MEVQVFGIRKSSDTRKALRFFAERRIKTHFVDLQERAASPGELRRFAQKFGVEALVDRGSRRFAGVRVEFGATRLLDDVTFTVARGERWGIIGRNGTGKTTLFRLTTGELRP